VSKSLPHVSSVTVPEHGVKPNQRSGAPGVSAQSPGPSALAKHSDSFHEPPCPMS
jgi:hypothetical protein